MFDRKECPMSFGYDLVYVATPGKVIAEHCS